MWDGEEVISPSSRPSAQSRKGGRDPYPGRTWGAGSSSSSCDVENTTRISSTYWNRHFEHLRSNPAVPQSRQLDCFVARAPRNDGRCIRRLAASGGFEPPCPPQFEERRRRAYQSDQGNRSNRCILSHMPNYRRASVSGGCFFFTLNLLARR